LLHKHRGALPWFILVVAGGMATAGSDLDRRIDTELPSLLEIYEDLHLNPELSFEGRSPPRGWPPNSVASALK
jgi:hypothetical protein